MTRKPATFIAAVGLCAGLCAAPFVEADESDGAAPASSRAESESNFDFSGNGVADRVIRESMLVEGQRQRRVRIVAASGQETLAIFQSPAMADRFGEFVALADDMDGDGIPELLISAPATLTEAVLGAAYLFSGATGEVLHAYTGSPDHDDQFAVYVERLEDLDGDGFAELVIWSRFTATGDPWRAGDVLEYPTIICGRTGDVLIEDRDFPHLVRPVGDVTGNGRVEMRDVQLILDAIGAGGAARPHLDLSGDGLVGVDDLFIVMQNLGRAGSGAGYPGGADDPCVVPDPPQPDPADPGPEPPHIPDVGDPTSGDPREAWELVEEDLWANFPPPGASTRQARAERWFEDSIPCPPETSEEPPAEPEEETEDEDPCEPRHPDHGWVLWVNSDDDDLDGWIDHMDPEIEGETDMYRFLAKPGDRVEGSIAWEQWTIRYSPQHVRLYYLLDDPRGDLLDRATPPVTARYPRRWGPKDEELETYIYFPSGTWIEERHHLGDSFTPRRFWVEAIRPTRTFKEVSLRHQERPRIHRSSGDHVRR